MIIIARYEKVSPGLFSDEFQFRRNEHSSSPLLFRGNNSSLNELRSELFFFQLNVDFYRFEMYFRLEMVMSFLLLPLLRHILRDGLHVVNDAT
jgi:hypothetical protein